MSAKNDFQNERKITHVKAGVTYSQQIQFLRHFNRLPLAILCVLDEFEYFFRFTLIILYVSIYT